MSGGNQKACSDEEFLWMFPRLGATEMSRKLGISERTIYRRRKYLEKTTGQLLPAPASQIPPIPGELNRTVQNGTILVASDAHYWPGDKTTAHRAFVKFVKKMNPQIVVMNGDVKDGARISRHPPDGWENKPTPKEELDVCIDRLNEIHIAAKNAELIWPRGNHDARWGMRLAAMVPDFKDVPGMDLSDHFPDWQHCVSLMINGDVLIKHRWKGGSHAPWNNTLNSGISFITGHMHSLKVIPLTDRTGTRYGVDTGFLADIYGGQFSYSENNPRDWRSGFIVLTFHDGVLLWPEIVHVIESGKVQFRGEIIDV